MATTKTDIRPATQSLHGHMIGCTWATLGSGDSGNPSTDVNHADRSVQITNVSGGIGAVAIQGTNDDCELLDPASCNWYALHDLQGNSLGALATAGIYQIAEVTRGIRPTQTGGGVNAVTLVGRASI